MKKKISWYQAVGKYKYRQNRLMEIARNDLWWREPSLELAKHRILKGLAVGRGRPKMLKTPTGKISKVQIEWVITDKQYIKKGGIKKTSKIARLSEKPLVYGKNFNPKIGPVYNYKLLANLNKEWLKTQGQVFKRHFAKFSPDEKTHFTASFLKPKAHHNVAEAFTNKRRVAMYQMLQKAGVPYDPEKTLEDQFSLINQGYYGDLDKRQFTKNAIFRYQMDLYAGRVKWVKNEKDK